ncbi:MAG TPA: SRPBCC family protein [Kofleriaceae bacterium]|nr:SRPBCC family protein [Kofleriaceae bacterium]
MATITKHILTTARPEAVWAVIRDVGALHTRLVPGFVVDTRVEPGTPVVRVVTFASGAVVREPIVSSDDEARRLVWTVEGGAASHFNGSVEVLPGPSGGSRVVWRSDVLPDAAAAAIDAAMTAGAAAMTAALAKLG